MHQKTKGSIIIKKTAAIFLLAGASALFALPALAEDEAADFDLSSVTNPFLGE